MRRLRPESVAVGIALLLVASSDLATAAVPSPPPQNPNKPPQPAAITRPRSPVTVTRPEWRRKAERFDPRAVKAAPIDHFVAVPQTNQIQPEWLLPPASPFTLGPGDVIDIEILGLRANRASTLVGPDGRIYFFLLPGLDVWGLSLDETRSLLERELGRYLQTPPQVSVGLRSVGSKRIWLLGRLNAPGLYPLSTPMTLLEAVALAGGPVSSGATDLADLKNGFVVRHGQAVTLDFESLLRTGDLSQNIYLQADDLLYLPSALNQQVYVLGAVLSPQPIAFRPKLTLLAAIASTGGPARGARLGNIAIVRGSLSDPKIATVNLPAIIRGQATDVLLEPRDIVYVPQARFQFLGRYMSLIMSTFVSTIAVNEGVRAVDSSAPPVGISNVPTTN